MQKALDLKKHATEGLRWMTLGQILTYILQFAVYVMLARMVAPENFGALSAAFLFSNMALVINELGMVSAIIQKKDLFASHISTGFWVCVAMGSIFFMVGVLGAPLLASFFKDLTVRWLVIFFAFKFFVDSFGMINEAMLKRELLFKKLSLIEIQSNCVYAASTVFFALKGTGIVSMALGYLTASILRLFLLRRAHPFIVSGWDKKSFFELFHFGKNILGFKILNYFAGNIDVIMIGRWLGTAVLGYYGLALTLANFPRLKLSFIISSVFFPAFSRIQEDIAHLREAYLRIVRYAAVVNFALLSGLLVLASPFVHIVYSSKWEAMIFPLRILCLYGMVASITTFVGVIYNSTGNAHYSLRFCFFNLLSTVIAVAIGLRYGLIAVVSALAVNALFLNLLGQILVRRLIHMKLRDYFNSFLPALTASGFMVLFLTGMLRLNDVLPGLNNVVFFAASVLFGAVVYVLSLYVFHRKTFLELKEIGFSLLSARPK